MKIEKTYIVIRESTIFDTYKDKGRAIEIAKMYSCERVLTYTSNSIILTTVWKNPDVYESFLTLFNRKLIEYSGVIGLISCVLAIFYLIQILK